ncbi:MAG: hypothetical protein JHC84_08615 [Solirubrobacteraceae bacterium]|nr:hypothetical protein [Solirubrobacteraceae bacterium]
MDDPSVSREPRRDVDRETLRQILATPIDTELASELDEAEAPVFDPRPGE